jgi:hypothetical protein
MMKSEVFCDSYLDGKLQNSMPQNRVVYTDKKGRYVQSEGRKYYLDPQNHYKWEAFTIGKSMSFQEMIEDVKRKNEEALETHKKNGGMCQHCGKNKAEFPNGLNPFNCKECNEETQKIVNQLSKDPGFVQLRV